MSESQAKRNGQKGLGIDDSSMTVERETCDCVFGRDGTLLVRRNGGGLGFLVEEEGGCINHLTC